MSINPIRQVIVQRDITEVLHFTTNNGLIGILATGNLLAHSELPKESILSHILQINCPDRSRDTEWHSYVNLSISRLNGSFFEIARNKWHRDEDIFWCILSFSSEIMEHDGVYFSTTNNAYDMTERGNGIEALNALFKPTVKLFPTKLVHRPEGMQTNRTTCHQAEVLYPKALPIQYLKCIYLSSNEHLSEVEAQIGVVCAPKVTGKFQLIVAPELFT